MTLQVLLTVLLTGTDPEEPKGGIGVAMDGYVTALQAARLDFRLIPSYRPGVPGGRWWWALRAGRRLTRAIRTLRRERRTPIVYAHGGRGIGLLRQSLLLYVAQVEGARTMLQLHSMSVDRYLRSPTGRAFLRFCLWPADRVCVLTDWWASRLRTLAEGLAIAVIPNPLPPELERIAREGRTVHREREDGSLHLLTVTRLVPGKGVALAIRAMAFLPSTFRLRIAGDGCERARYERLTARLGLQEQIEFSGWVDGEDKYELFRSNDAFLLPTRNDSFGMGFVEAMAHGLPIVAVRWGPIAQVVPDGRAGVLVNDAKPAALAEAVLGLSDGAVRMSMGDRGRAWVLERFGASSVGEKIREAVTSLAGSTSAEMDAP